MHKFGSNLQTSLLVRICKLLYIDFLKRRTVIRLSSYSFCLLFYVGKNRLVYTEWLKTTVQIENVVLLLCNVAQHDVNGRLPRSSSSPWLPVKPIRAYFFNGKGVGLDHLIISCLRASADDGVTVNAKSQARTSNDVEDLRYKLDQSLQDEDYNTGLVQLLHDAARVFELAIKEQISLSKISWFSTAWLGVDKNAWAKALSYQASVYSLLQAASEISSRGDGRDRDINVFVQRSLSRQSAPLESVIKDKLLAKQPENYDWFWSEQIPAVVTSFVNYFEKEQRFAPANAVLPFDKGNWVAREFLVHFGPRAAACRMKNELGAEEIMFWVGIVQKQLRAIDRERIWSRLTTSESIEVVCEELDWLPFYPGSSTTSKRTFGHKNKESPPNTEAIPLVLDVCSHWIESFIKYSKWLENPTNVKAARFLSKGEFWKVKILYAEDASSLHPAESQCLGSDHSDEALENVEEALLRLEELLQELHVSNSSSGKEHLKAACSDLERIRRLKKETEFLEASFFRAKAASLQQGDVSGLSPPVGEQQQYSRGKGSKSSDMETDRSSRMMSSLNKKLQIREIADSESDEIQRFELLRSELMELEKREEVQVKDNASMYNSDAKGSMLVRFREKDSIIEKSLDKLKETSTLLAIDTAAAVGLLRRVLIGDELTEKEKQALRRTLTDLAAVTAVGHAAMLAAIQRYVPSLIPSTYGPERLDLLRQLEKVKELEDDVNINENAEE
ncbi:hypothetical protein DH2020_018170 [Rehmannia glutinosa]|uniref:Uncharacterized protein n=1 Tax=Rehmannia glutinosa TaxID=99300 RepID=A0ABR0WK50_REHGL